MLSLFFSPFCNSDLNSGDRAGEFKIILIPIGVVLHTVLIECHYKLATVVFKSKGNII